MAGILTLAEASGSGARTGVDTTKKLWERWALTAGKPKIAIFDLSGLGRFSAKGMTPRPASGTADMSLLSRLGSRK